MDSTPSKNYSLKIRPPKLKNLLFALIFAVLAAVFVVIFVLNLDWTPETVTDKILNCFVFAVSLVGALLSFSGMVDSIRNIFAFPTFKLDEENIFICKYGTSPLSELESTELKKNGKILVFNFKDGSSAVLRCRLSEIPLKTVEYSISLVKK